MTSKTTELLYMLEMNDHEFELEYTCPQYDVKVDNKFRIRNTPDDTLCITIDGNEKYMEEYDSAHKVFNEMLRLIAIQKPDLVAFRDRIVDLASKMQYITNDWNRQDMTDSTFDKINKDYPKDLPSFCELSLYISEWAQRMAR